jgi:hypothetical protein
MVNQLYKGTVASQIYFTLFTILGINFTYFEPNMLNIWLKIAKISPKN